MQMVKQETNVRQKGIQAQLAQLSMQTELESMPSKVQQILPILSEFNDSDYDYLYNLLMTLKNKNSQQKSQKTDTSTRLGRHLGMMSISDDFTDELDDEFWGF